MWEETDSKSLVLLFPCVFEGIACKQQCVQSNGQHCMQTWQPLHQVFEAVTCAERSFKRPAWPAL